MKTTTIEMEKLDRYFGDKRKIVWDCVDEITKFPKVAHSDYKQLVALKCCLEINYARLKGCNLERKMNNTSCMKLIERKFPSAQQLELTKYLE